MKIADALKPVWKLKELGCGFASTSNYFRCQLRVVYHSYNCSKNFMYMKIYFYFILINKKHAKTTQMS